ncbi:hypothetical protein HFX_2981 [Haloferax mediterranei ATCC 33500]|uniref:Uncharacterized protein n=1 Tax=Haloferax mediterranei (strain ATCC 33500 / DSM 1411 / JCM 8866 / NBRC 14739 / NCIMB 2177 / R-4) TaxID=523841 RepID=I3R8T6_HALMT|nr:hypothetical protein HFX_2981 [Haloferax mediterranei ATCC 33500]
MSTAGTTSNSGNIRHCEQPTCVNAPNPVTEARYRSVCDEDIQNNCEPIVRNGFVSPEYRHTQ